MNGISYGRFDGIANQHNFARRQFAYNGTSPRNSAFNFGAEWSKQQQKEQHSQQNFVGWPADVPLMMAANGLENNFGNNLRPNSTSFNGFISNRGNSPSRRTTTALSLQPYEKFPLSKQPLTKQVDQLHYVLPQNKFSKNALCQPPEFLKVFCDVRSPEGGRAVFDCVLLGSPRPRVHWLFNDEKLQFDDVLLEDTADICRCTIKNVRPYHYGVYSILAENEVGRAITTATLLPVIFNQY